MSLTYSTFVSALIAETELIATDPNVVTMLPVWIDDAEQLCYRELDLLASVVTVTGAATANTRAFTIPTSSGHMLVVDAVNVIDGTGKRNTCLPVTREVIDFLYPSETAPFTPSIPKQFCRPDDLTIKYGPAPDGAYTVEVIGTIRPAALSASNTTTFLTNTLPDLFFAAAMISVSGYMRNFGVQADDPKMSVNWQQQFDKRLVSAQSEELRKSYVSDMSTPPVSQKDA